MLLRCACLPFAVVAGLLGAPPAHADLRFDSASYPVTTSFGAAITAADLNGDGRADLASSSSYEGAGAASMLLGRGDATFQPVGPPVAAGLAIAAADLDGDGRTDLATAGMSNMATVLLGRGDGTFERRGVGGPYDGGAPGGVLSIAITQLGGTDPGLDLVVTNIQGLHVLLGKGDGTFATPVTYPGWDGGALVTGDFTQDGRADIGVTRTNGASGAISVLPGDGAGGLGTPITTPLDRPVGFPVASDDDRDGLLDIVAADRGPYTSEIGIFYGEGDGTFALLADVDVGASPTALGVGHLDADGGPDVVAGTTDGLATWFDTGAVADAGLPLRDYDFPRGIAVADFDADGLDDVATLTYFGDVIVSRNAPGLATTAPATGLAFAAGTTFQSVTVTNTGLATLRVDGVYVEGPAAGDFAPSGSCVNATVPTGGTCAVALTYSARGPGTRAATLVLRGNQADGPTRIALAGTGVTPPPAAPRDTAAPRVKVTTPRQRLAAVLRRGLTLRYTSSENGSLELAATVDTRTARRLGLSRAGKPYVIGRAEAALTADRAANVRVRISRKAIRAVRRQRSLTLTVNATVADVARNRTISKRVVRLRR